MSEWISIDEAAYIFSNEYIPVFFAVDGDVLLGIGNGKYFNNHSQSYSDSEVTHFQLIELPESPNNQQEE